MSGRQSRISLACFYRLSLVALLPLIFASTAWAQGGGKTPSIRMTNAEQKTTYTNMSRVTNTAEEFVIDLAFLDEPILTAKRDAELRARVVMSPYAAKRLMLRLQSSIKTHEDTFGTIELDVRERAKNPR